MKWVVISGTGGCVSLASYKKNGMIGMMQRNIGVKKAPQRFQEEKDLSKIDICICFDDRVFDAVIEGIRYMGLSLRRFAVSWLSWHETTSHSKSAHTG